MLELYQSENCRDCARVRAALARLGASYIVRTVPFDRGHRARVVEAGGRPDIPLLVDPERGRTTYEAEEIVLQLGAEDLFQPDETPEPGLPHLYQHEGHADSDAARRALGAAGLDYICHDEGAGAADIPRLVGPRGGTPLRGLAAIRGWLGGERGHPAGRP
jgi:glutaredoxin